MRFNGSAKSTAHVITLFALSNLWTFRKKPMAMAMAMAMMGVWSVYRGCRPSQRVPLGTAATIESLDMLHL